MARYGTLVPCLALPREVLPALRFYPLRVFIFWAFQVLSDEKERRTYDATLRSLAHLRG